MGALPTDFTTAAVSMRRFTLSGSEFAGDLSLSSAGVRPIASVGEVGIRPVVTIAAVPVEIVVPGATEHSVLTRSAVQTVVPDSTVKFVVVVVRFEEVRTWSTVEVIFP